MAGYTRQSSLNNGDTITAALFNNEYNQLLAAFNASSGHKHDGTAAEGPVIALIGDAGLTTPLNKILIDTANDEIGFHIDVSGTSTEQFKLLDGAIVPITTNDIDLGSSSLQFKDAFFDGTVTLDGLTIGSATSITDVDTDITSVSASDDTIASAKAIKTYVDAQVATIPVGDITSVVAGAGMTGGGTSGDVTLNVIGGTGIDVNANDIAIDSTVATLTGSQVLTGKTIDVDNNTLSNIEVDNLKSGVLDTDLASVAAGDTTLASAKAIKSYVDTEIATIPVGDITSVVAGTGLSGGATSGAATLNIDTATTVDVSTAQTLTNKILTSPVLNTSISGTAFKDEDNMSSDSATSVASQQSIKAYVDTQVATIPTGDITEVVAGTGLSGGGTTGSVTLNAEVSATSTNAFTNKTIDADATGNNITNIENANIKSAAAIDATKIADGSVTSAEFQYINSLSSNAQTQIDLKAPLASPALTGNPTAPTQSAGNNSTRIATTAYVDNSQAARDQLSEMTDVTLSGLADANYFIYDNSASKWKNKAISGAITSNKEGVTTLASAIDATKIADGSVTSTEFQYINSLSSNAQTQLDAKQATIDASNRLNANLIHDGTVDNTEFGYLNGVTSAIQTQIDARASNGFAVAMAIAL